jgi:YD repeat-containing protein
MTYTFDGDGNLAGRLDAGLPSLTMTWDYEDRMTSFTLSDVPLTDTADYDPDYRRISHRWR